MKFPSVKTLADSAANTIKRFPFEVLFSLAGTIATIINIELDNINRIGENWCIRVIMMANIGLLLTLSATLYAESRGLAAAKKLLLRLAAVGIAIGVLFIINPGVRQADYIRFILLSLSAHLLVAFAAFTGRDSVQGFWQFNKTLFLRILTAALYSVVLGLGLSAAIGAVNYLFGFDFEFDTFQILWTCIGGLFNTLFFLAGVPADFNQLNTDQSYPKGLKIFTQYVLIPLATVYLLILLAYEVKIISEWNLPKGAVSYLILGYAVFGILSLLLVYPIREQEENKWLKTYARSFYFLMIPLLALLFAAVGVRVFRYGITELRYFLMMLACWLLFITLYFLVFKKQNIKLIPISLCIAALVTVYGPQSAFSVSAFSQKQIFTQILKKNNALKDGKAIQVKKITGADGRRLASSMEYLVNQHGLESLQPLFNEDLEKVSDSLSLKKSEYYTGSYIDRYELRQQKLEWVQKKLNIHNYYDYSDDSKYASVNKMIEHRFRTGDDMIAIEGYEYILPVTQYYNADNKGAVQTFNGLRYHHFIDNNDNYKLTINSQSVIFNSKEIAKQLISLEKEFTTKKYKVASSNNGYITQNEFALPQKLLIFSKESKDYIVTLAIKQLTVSQTGNKIDANYIDGNYLIKKK